MFVLLSDKIRALTLKAADLVIEKQIEQCLSVLVERQTLLEKFAKLYQESSADKHANFTAIFTELITWVQQQDASNSSKILELREQSRKNCINQVKTKKAISHYKKFT